MAKRLQQRITLLWEQSRQSQAGKIGLSCLGVANQNMGFEPSCPLTELSQPYNNCRCIKHLPCQTCTSHTEVGHMVPHCPLTRLTPKRHVRLICYLFKGAMSRYFELFFWVIENCRY